MVVSYRFSSQKLANLEAQNLYLIKIPTAMSWSQHCVIIKPIIFGWWFGT
jgi:hypothetical protein